MDERQRTLHDARQGIDAFVKQRPAAEQNVERGIEAVVDVKGRVVHQVRIAVRHVPRCHNGTLGLFVVAIEISKGRDDGVGGDTQDHGILVGRVGLESINKSG